MALNYNHLRYFWTVAHEGGLTRAAERLNLSQSALSVQIQKLEAQVGHPLFQREGRRLALTEAGRIALDAADTIFAAGDELVATLRGVGPRRQLALRVGALTTLSRNFQLDFLRPLVGRPDVEFILRTGSMADLLGELERHALDVVLTNHPAPRDASAPFRSTLLDQQPVSLVGRPRGSAPPFRYPDDLADTPVLLPSLDSGLRLAFDQAMEKAGVRPIVHAEVDDMAMLRLIARERDGVALVPPIVVRDELLAGTLEEYCRLPEIAERFYAVTTPRRFPSPLLADLLSRDREADRGERTRADPLG